MATATTELLSVIGGGIPALIQDRYLLLRPEFQKIMEWKSARTVEKAVASGRIFYLTHDGERYFPSFYADRRYKRSHLSAVTHALGNIPGGSKFQFFINPKGSLGGVTPLDALAADRVSKVLDVAHAFAER